MKIWTAPYELTPRAALNSQVGAQPRVGCLLRLEEKGSEGFADLHPWPEFGDEPLSLQLDLLQQGQMTAVSRQSLEIARLDAEARAQGVSLFSNLKIPESHFLLNDPEEWTLEKLEALKQEGFTTVKMKVGREPEEELSRLKTLAAGWPKQMRLRLDFNSALEVPEFKNFCLSLEKSLPIELIEDPVPYSANVWGDLSRELALAFAYDRPKPAEASNDPRPDAFRFLILKPAVQDVRIWSNSFKSSMLVVTSYLDHPLGQMSAAYWAAQLAPSGRLAICGLLSHFAYHPTEFSEQLKVEGAFLQPMMDPGLGFAELLQKQNWRALE